MTEPISTFNDDLDQVMQGICPKCGNQMTEELTDYASQEWTVTCTGCPYKLIFGGI